MIINLPMPSITDRDIYDQLNIPYLNGVPALPVYFGGPVETSRGFVLYCGEPLEEETIASNEGVILSSNVRLLRDIAVGGGPQHRILGLGYAGWAAGQLESEIESGSWICVPSTKHLIFETNNEDKWALAAQSIGVDMLRYSPHAGHA